MDVTAVTASGTPKHGFDVFRRGWEAQTGEAYPAPRFTPGRRGDFRISARAVKAHDSVIADVRSESMIGTNGGFGAGADSAGVGGADRGASPPRDDQVLMHVVRENAWRFSRRRDGELIVPAGNFMVQRTGPPTFEVARHTAASVLIVPASDLGPLIRDRLIAGPAASAEMRLLLAHVNLVHESVQDLTPAGVQAAHNALIELLKGVLRQRADGTEPQLAHALARSAQDLVDSRLADPDLSPQMLARELGVSVRTLHRAFAATEETVGGCIRRRRLERARRELLAATGRPSISDLAAHWQFADSSHFIRAFKRQYGRTPAEFARGSGDTKPSTP
ncbi:helix-turn-helix domain-containing protein [Streptomyces sp. NPDC007971]|uniref:helix-turn-helix domain-containing protein n=1 Tax=Streptomyces sp. NPDC007971 TaxID=3364799 RepID=UPI0036E2CA9F